MYIYDLFHYKSLENVLQSRLIALIHALCHLFDSCITSLVRSLSVLFLHFMLFPLVTDRIMYNNTFSLQE